MIYKIKKSEMRKLIKEALGDVLANMPADRTWDPSISTAEKIKDNLQTAMIDSAKDFLQNLYRGTGLSDKAVKDKIDFAIFDLEDRLVESMYGFGIELPEKEEEEEDPGQDIIRLKPKKKV